MSLKTYNTLSLAPSKLQASLWMTQRVLLTPQELQKLFHSLPQFFLFSLSSVGPVESFALEKSMFLENYEAFFSTLYEQKDPRFQVHKKKLTVAMTADLDALHLVQASQDKYLVHLHRPVVVIGLSVFHYDAQAHKVMFSDHQQSAMRIGLEFKFPQFYQDPKTLQPVKHFTDKSNLNTQIFKAIQKWSRDHTQVLFLKSLNHPDLKLTPGCKIGNEALALSQKYDDFRQQRWSLTAARSASDVCV